MSLNCGSDCPHLQSSLRSIRQIGSQTKSPQCSDCYKKFSEVWTPPPSFQNWKIGFGWSWKLNAFHRLGCCLLCFIQDVLFFPGFTYMASTVEGKNDTSSIVPDAGSNISVSSFFFKKAKSNNVLTNWCPELEYYSTMYVYVHCIPTDSWWFYESALWAPCLIHRKAIFNQIFMAFFFSRQVSLHSPPPSSYFAGFTRRSSDIIKQGDK